MSIYFFKDHKKMIHQLFQNIFICRFTFVPSRLLRFADFPLFFIFITESLLILGS